MPKSSESLQTFSEELENLQKTFEMLQNCFWRVLTIFENFRKSSEIFKKLRKRFKTVFRRFYVVFFKENWQNLLKCSETFGKLRKRAFENCFWVVFLKKSSEVFWNYRKIADLIGNVRKSSQKLKCIGAGFKNSSKGRQHNCCAQVINDGNI